MAVPHQNSGRQIDNFAMSKANSFIGPIADALSAGQTTAYKMVLRIMPGNICQISGDRGKATEWLPKLKSGDNFNVHKHRYTQSGHLIVLI